MCLLVLAWQAHPCYRLIVAANRDEFHDRPAAEMAPWQEPPFILAGRDLRAGGTWLAVDRQRRFGVVTNFRDVQPVRANAPSRGALVSAFLGEAASARSYLTALEKRAASYAGFNLLLYDGEQLWYACNRAAQFAQPLCPGIYGLSNYFLDTPWPKLTRARRAFDGWLRAWPEATVDGLFAMLGDREPSPQEPVPGQPPLPPEWQQVLSSPFVLHPTFGTRSASLVLIEPGGALTVRERRFDAQGQVSGADGWTLAAGDWP